MKNRKMAVVASVSACAVFGLLMGIPSGDARGEKSAQAADASQGEYKLQIPFGLEETAVVIPVDNPLTTEKIELGRALFFDKRLSNDNTVACANCHLAQFAFTDGKPVAQASEARRAGAARRPRSIGCSAACNFGTAGPPPWKSNRSGPLRIRSSTALPTTM